MRKFDYSKLQDKKIIDNEIISNVIKIHEYKTCQKLYETQKIPTLTLNRLINISKTQSTKASNSIEGIMTTESRLQKIVDDKIKPQNKEEYEILGYKNLLDLIHQNYQHIQLNSNYILQLHKNLYKYSSLEFAGKFKSTNNFLTETSKDGETKVIFTPLDPFETPNAVKSICENYKNALALNTITPLILIPIFILDFLCIHPFLDGNGRMSRLLTLLLLYQNNFLVGRYISLEKEILDTLDDYYNAIRLSNKNWHSGKNDYKPFIKYFLSITYKCYKDLEERITTTNKLGKKLNSYDIVKNYVSNTIGKFSKRDVLLSCPTIGSSSVEAALKKLVENKLISRLGSGKNTAYVKKKSFKEEKV
ncbi:MAG: Fic family protein [Bdellovibrionota bacterium]